MGILDAVITEARNLLRPKMDTMKTLERHEWTRACNDYWLAEQAFEGALQAAQAGEMPPVSFYRAKFAIAELGEQVLQHVSRCLGGMSFSRSAPFGQWSQDIKALGLLRPPWALAVDQLFEASWEA